MEILSRMKIKIFMDGADVSSMRQAVESMPYVKGFTTNPTLMRKAGVVDYQDFAQKALAAVGDMPISFEVFSDDFQDMERQARLIASWGKNAYVKIPVTNTKRESATPLIRRLSSDGIKLNVTAILSLAQVKDLTSALRPDVPSIVSVFAGRVADTGVDPVPLMRECLSILSSHKKSELLWASPRELLNILQADEMGCHIITVTDDILKKLKLLGKNLEDYSLETVKMFYDDAQAAGFEL